MNEPARLNRGVRYATAQGIAEITLDNPPANALGEDMISEIIDCLHHAKDDPQVRVVLLCSANPKIFCAGLDLAALQRASSAESHRLLEKLYPQLYDAQFHLGKPSIAVVGGAARGGGMTLAISCDMILAADTASFGYPEVNVGVPPAIHFTHLPRIIGRNRAFDLLFTGRTFGAVEAERLGLVNRVVASPDLLEEAKALAHVLASKSPEVTRLARAAFMRANDSDYRRGVAGAVDTFCQVLATDDGKEGLAAFVEKRAPRWKP
jgi:enoyl-CoA hydratase/carnithine racemase